MLLPFLPYRKPTLLRNYNSLIALLKDTKKQNILLVTDKGIRNLNLTKTLEEKIKKAIQLLNLIESLITDNQVDCLNWMDINLDKSCEGLIPLQQHYIIIHLKIQYDEVDSKDH